MNSENINNERLFPVRPSFARDALWTVSIALFYFAVARFSLKLVIQPEGIAAIWPPEGIFLSAILLTRRNLRFYLVGALFIADLIAEVMAGTPFLVSVIYSLALSGDAAFSSWLLLRFVKAPFSFQGVRDVVGFLFFAVILSNALTSSVAAAAATSIPGTSFWQSWTWWAASDGIGNLLLTPFILSWASLAGTWAMTWKPKRVVEGTALFLSLAVLNYAAFRYLSEHSQFSLLYTYLTFPFLLWAAIRFGLRGMSSGLVILAAISIHFTMVGHGANISRYGSPLDAVILLQLSLAVIAVPSLFLSAVVTERKRSQESLQQSKQSLEMLNRISRAFLTSSSDGKLYDDVLRVVLETMESPFGVFGFINEKGDLVCPSMTRHIWSQCQMSNKTIVFPENTWGDSIWGHGLRTGEPRYVNKRFTVPEGHVPIDRCLTAPLLYQGRSIGLLTVANKQSDYTDDNLDNLRRIGAHVAPVLNAMLTRQRSEEEREKLQNQLMQAQKLESIGQLAGGIAHDFNNVLAAIVGYGSILQMKMPSDDPSRTYTEQILAATERAAGLTQSLLAFSRKQVINPRNIDLNMSIRKVEKFLSRIIGEDISLAMSLCAEPPTIFADATQIEQVLMNLATNARDAMPKGGKLIISTEQIEYDAAHPVTLSFGKAGRYAVLSVTDTGTGMDEQTQAKIFEPFFTTKEVGRGTGLGLAIVYGVVKQNNGHINVYSEAGKGTTFKIYFPLVAASADSRNLAAVPVTLRVGTETILLAEDDEILRALTRQVLSEYGYTVIEAANGETALKMFLENSDRVRLIITDVIMPQKSGREFYEAARKIRPDIKVIFTSGYPSDLIQKEGALEKGLHFLPKPSSPQALLQKVREALDQLSH